MIGFQKDSSEHLLWDQMKHPHPSSSSSSSRTLPKLILCFTLFISFTYFIYTLQLLSSSPSCPPNLPKSTHSAVSTTHPTHSTHSPQRASLQLHHIVFCIAASSNLWEKRKHYINSWWRNEMRGVVWLDKPVNASSEHEDPSATTTLRLPPMRISSNTSSFAYKNPQGHRSAIRISRVVSETFRLRLPNVRWFVMGDDDTFFVSENLVRVLAKYDDRQYWYIGSLSDSHLQNIYFSYGMAYGGGGFAMSYGLVEALEKMQDKCISRYPALYGSDDRMHACMAELGVPLTKEVGFHQFDVYGNLFGLLSAHPVAPLVTLHHLDVVEPIFPNMTRVQSLEHLTVPMKLDSAGLIQQSICYDKQGVWTVSVSWGYAVQIIRGVFSAREMEKPSRTFLNWYKRADYTAYAFNTRPVSRNSCQKPFVFYMSTATFNSTSNQTVSEYVRHHVPHPKCKWKMANPDVIERIQVYKRPDPHLWDKSPRRNCCRVLPSENKSNMVIDVGVCGEGELSEI